MKKTIETLLYMGLLLVIGVLMSAGVYGMEQLIGKLGTFCVLLVGVFLLIRMTIR